MALAEDQAEAALAEAADEMEAVDRSGIPAWEMVWWNRRGIEFVNSVVDSRVSSYLLGVLSCLSNLAPVLCIQILKIALFFKDFLKTVQRFPADWKI